MLRIRGTVGSFPVDLEVSLDQEDWDKLIVGVLGSKQTPQVNVSEVSSEVSSDKLSTVSGLNKIDSFLEPALALVRQAGAISGPSLLVKLEGLSGNMQAAKQLLMRLRHSNQVVVERGAEALIYRWREVA